MTVYWVVWDAGAHWVVDRLERQGALPAVRRMRAAGRFGPARPARPNCQTPPSLATLFTGAWPERHAVTGFTVPGASGHPASEVSGFSARFPAVPPVWRHAFRAGLRGSFVHVPWVFDAESGLDPGVDAAIEAYSHRVTRPGVHLLDPQAGRQDWSIGPHLLRVEAGDAHSGHRARRVAVEVPGPGRPVPLPTDGSWRPVPLDADHGTWIRRVPTRHGPALLHSGAWRPRIGGRDRAAVDRLRRCPPFTGEGVGPLYRDGLFGPRLAEGGDGSAEAVLLSSIGCVARSFTAAVDAALAGADPDLMVIYLPITDDIGHELLGWCDERSGAYRPDLAPAVWSSVRRCYRWADAVLGRVLDRAGPQDTVLLGADHGMVGSTHLVHVNDELVRAGLAARTADGRLDADRSPVFYHPANNGSLWTTGESPARSRHLLEQARAVLDAVTEPVTGRPVVAGYLDARGAAVDGPIGDPDVLYLVLADDYQPSAELMGVPPAVRRTAKTGAHVVYTGDPRLHAVFAAVGPGIPTGDEPEPVDNTEPAALVLDRLGIGAGSGRFPPDVAGEYFHAAATEIDTPERRM